METKLYYTPPSDEVFKEVKEKSIEIWKDYDDTYGYATEKVDSIKGIANISDNFIHIVSKFDMSNQVKLSDLLSRDAKLAVRERMLDGGTPRQYIVF